MSENSEIDVAAAAFKALQEKHIIFMQSVQRQKNKKVNGGEIDSDGQLLAVGCLNVDFKIAPRFIVRDKYLCSIEYPFMTKVRDQEILVWQMYLEADGSLYSDFDKKQRICDSTNENLASYLIKDLGAALLRSPVFSPLQR